MKFSQVEKGQWIVNTAVNDSRPWIVCCKVGDFICVRRGPKVGVLVGISRKQLKDFKLFCQNCGEPV